MSVNIKIPHSNRAVIRYNKPFTHIGGRITGEIMDITLEGGYLSEGASELHKTYIAAHGALLVDWYLASSLTIPNEEPDSLTTEEYVQDSWAISCGFFNMINLEGDASLNLRFEAGIFPYGEWEEWEPDPAILGMQFPTSPYGLYLFPEISYAPESNMSFQLRSLISPVDLSAVPSFFGLYTLYTVSLHYYPIYTCTSGT